MDKITKLSQAVRYGSTFLEESIFLRDYDNQGNICGGCVIGTAYLAVINRNPTDPRWFEEVSKRFDVPFDIIYRISTLHFTGQLNRAECANWLEEKGY